MGYGGVLGLFGPSAPPCDPVFPIWFQVLCEAHPPASLLCKEKCRLADGKRSWLSRLPSRSAARAVRGSMTQQRQRRIRDLLNPRQRQDLEYAYSRALGYALKSLRLSAADAEDIVAAALVRAMERLDKYVPRPDVPFTAWFQKVLLNLVRDEHRNRQRAERLRDLAANAAAPASPRPPDLRIMNAQARACRDRLVAELPPDLRTVLEVWAEQRARLVARDVAAERLGCSISEYEAAKKRVRREVEGAMQRLGLRVEDLWSAVPRVSGGHSARGHERERGT